jgi:hypothetical protein
MKLPLTLKNPACFAHPADPVNTAEEPGLEIEHDWSVGKNPVPLTITDWPGRAVPGLRVIFGPAVTLNIA